MKIILIKAAFGKQFNIKTNFIRLYQYSHSSVFFVLAIVFLQFITPLYLACIVAYLNMFIS